MLLPLFFKYFIADKRSLNFPKLMIYYLIVIGTLAITFLPFYSAEVFSNFMASIGLWFGKFEFNASIYYLVRWVGFQVKGYNIIETAGKILPVITVLIILGLSLLSKYKNSKQLLENMLLAVTAYLLLSTTVHPWYLGIPLMLSLFTEFRFMLAWTLVVMLSYFTYSNPEYHESPWLLVLEYLVVGSFLGKDLLMRSKRQVAY